MASGNWAPVASAALTIALLGTPQSAPAQTWQHPGQVSLVDKTERRSVGVEIRAWPESKETGKQGDCPQFGKEALDHTQSENKEGRFLLKVDKKYRTYTITYCASDIFPRADPDIVNRSDGAGVVPRPVELYPRASGNDRATYSAALEQKLVRLIGVLNDLAYYQSISAERFNETLKEFSATVSERDKGRAGMLSEFGSVVQRWKQ